MAAVARARTPSARRPRSSAQWCGWRPEATRTRIRSPTCPGVRSMRTCNRSMARPRFSRSFGIAWNRSRSSLMLSRFHWSDSAALRERARGARATSRSLRTTRDQHTQCDERQVNDRFLVAVNRTVRGVNLQGADIITGMRVPYPDLHDALRRALETTGLARERADLSARLIADAS